MSLLLDQSYYQDMKIQAEEYFKIIFLKKKQLKNGKDFTLMDDPAIIILNYNSFEDTQSEKLIHY